MNQDNIAPAFEIAVSGQRLNVAIEQLVESLSVETAESAAGLAELTVLDPGNRFIDNKVFAPGNELDVWFGWGDRVSHAGRFIIATPSISFPGDGPTSISVKAFTKDWRMMGNGPEHEQKKPPVEKKKGVKRPPAKKGLHGRAFKDVTYADVVKAVAATYSFNLDVDKTPGGVTSLIQKSGMTDYELVRSIANITGFLFWVDADPTGRWTLHFRDPQRIYTSTSAFAVQKKRYTFEYGFGNGALLSADASFSMSDARTRVRASYRNPRTGKTITGDVEEEAVAPDMIFEGKNEKIAQPLPSAGAVRIYIDDFQIEAIPDKRFETQAQLEMWLRVWFRRWRDMAITLSGSVVGVEDLRCFQIHKLDGLGKTFSGDHYFSRVRHTFTRESGYLTEFSTRKVIE